VVGAALADRLVDGRVRSAGTAPAGAVPAE
jgi:hypothetical protein